MEQTIGCALFLRLPRGLELTPAGKELLKHARSIMDAINSMADEMSDFASGVRGRIRIWANTSAVIQYLPHDLANFSNKNPNIGISLEEKMDEEIVAAINEGKADIGILTDNTSTPGIDKFFYRHDQLVVLVPKDHPLAFRSSIEFLETLDYDFVGLNQGSSLLRRLMDVSTALGRSIRIRIQVRSFDAACRMIRAGFGIGILPEGAIQSEIMDKKLNAVPLVDTWGRRTLWLGVKEGTMLQPETKKLLLHLSRESPLDSF
ncbi:DNA-binding transcriptional regulator, LysR family [Formivibrio citricus]|uniref:DNA-binding transcriptional regulator, LysR family n=2 Tax=Formivibrio citricus TaxID=83765 RepID=A0A1I4YHJ2_9NEIS|nr:DNA-binding transcriptional regulator, LysR family [Formivibrio citricus]